MRLILLFATLACGGCGVDSTRSMWAKPWTEPGRNHTAYQARHAGEVTAKVALTPATVALDVATDPATWYCLYVVGRVALECGAQTCCH